jgi:NTP pyrophosphatase (non-canonical NTP hydrolase)
MDSPKPPRQSNATFEEINQLIWQHLVDRDWDKSRTARALAISLSLEANELLEHYQWREDAVGKPEELADELADVLIFAFSYAQVTGIDAAQAIRDKLAKAAKKYPAEQFKGKDEAKMYEQWLKAKFSHREQKKGL